MHGKQKVKKSFLNLQNIMVRMVETKHSIPIVRNVRHLKLYKKEW